MKVPSFLSVRPLCRLTPLSRLTLESVWSLRSRALILLVRERRPALEPERANPLIFCHVPARFEEDSGRSSGSVNSGPSGERSATERRTGNVCDMESLLALVNDADCDRAAMDDGDGGT